LITAFRPSQRPVFPGTCYRPVNVRGDAGEIERAVVAFARTPNGGLIVTGGRPRRFTAN
jgi:hypothetical protein